MHNSKPAVSVIIPAYNSAKYILEAIESVLSQTYDVFEIIVVDDGSTDNTAEIVKKIASRSMTHELIPEICYFHQDNRGPAAARNTGIRAAKGDYIALLDSDDLWLPKKLELEVSKMVTDPGYDLVHTDRLRMDLNGCIVPKKCIAIPEGFIFNELLRQNFICASSVLVKKGCFTNVGLFDEDRNNRSEDYDMWLRIAARYRIGSVNEPLVKYRVNPSGFNRSMIKTAYDSERNAFLRALDHYSGDRESLKNKRLHGLMRRMGNSFLDVRDYREASYAFAVAVKMNYLDLRSAGYYVISKLMDRLKT